MKTFKFQREFSDCKVEWSDFIQEYLGKGHSFGLHWTEVDWIEPKSGRNVLCMDTLSKLFHVHPLAKDLWVTLRKTPAKGFYKASVPSDKHAYHYPFVIEVDGKTYETFSFVRNIYEQMGLKDGDDFYFNIEYSR